MRLDGRVVEATLNKIYVTVNCSCVNGDSLKHCNNNWCIIIIRQWNIYVLIEQKNQGLSLNAEIWHNFTW